MTTTLFAAYSIFQQSPDQFQKELRKFYVDVLQQFESDELSSKDLAYQVAGTLQFVGALTLRQEELGVLAGELELPDGQISGDITAKEQELLALLKEQI